MTKQDLRLSGLNWRLVVYYNIGPEVPEEVLITLWENWCSNKDIKKVILTLQNKNSGFTYTNSRDHISIMGIGKATSKEEFSNTVVHEIQHLQVDLCTYYGIPYVGEEPAIIAGEIAKAMYKGFIRYIK